MDMGFSIHVYTYRCVCTCICLKVYICMCVYIYIYSGLLKSFHKIHVIGPARYFDRSSATGLIGGRALASRPGASALASRRECWRRKESCTASQPLRCFGGGVGGRRGGVGPAEGRGDSAFNPGTWRLRKEQWVLGSFITLRFILGSKWHRENSDTRCDDAAANTVCCFILHAYSKRFGLLDISPLEPASIQ